ncbi:restriction endonuclease subunit S [Lentzea sp. NBRC 105346]|uniref:restriction endonuclease subunit S n=1 Tax=Lentzea sp. NBRC 105346 TaxID=3032205 RepID=UPI0025569751|nr:restriction endonuclease subunit S [Lentzea sp. NBRC 105346]
MSEQDSVRRFAHGTTHQTVYYPEAKAFHVCIPERTEQDATVALLGALDDKIENNKAIASIANKLARTKMVKLWQDHNLGSLTKESPILPPGWTRTTLGALCATGGGGIQTGPFGSQLHASDYVESGTPSVMPQNIGDNIITEDGIARVSLHDINRLSKYLLQEGDIVYSRRGDVKRRSLVRPHESGWLCGTGCLRVRTGASVEPLFMSHYLGEPEVQEWILQRAIGATMPNLNTSIMSELPVTLPPREVRQRFTDELSAVDARATHGLHENRILVDLRDTLLPQLMSGKLRIRDAERIVEDAV